MLLEKWEKTKTKTNRRCLQPQLVYNPAFNRRYFQKKRSIYYILSPILTFFKSILPIELCRMTYQVKLCGRELPADAAFINSARRCQWMMTGEQKWGETGRAGSRWLPSSKRQEFWPTSSWIFESVPQKTCIKLYQICVQFSQDLTLLLLIFHWRTPAYSSNLEMEYSCPGVFLLGTNRYSETFFTQLLFHNPIFICHLVFLEI